jgi:hypothetical protein
VAQRPRDHPLGDVERVGAGAGAQPAPRLGERAGRDHAVERQEQARGVPAERQRHPERQRAEREQPEEPGAAPQHPGEECERDEPRYGAAGEHRRAAGQLVAGQRRHRQP